jgi:dTDP-4-amino-4,6-dideoxygalactose transaminase
MRRHEPTWLSIYAPLSPSVYLHRRRRSAPFPLDQPGCRLFAQARQGLWHALGACGLAEGDEVLAPAYHHGCEIETLRRAGLRCRFYDVGETVEPRERDLDDLLGARTRALHLIHHMGFPQDSCRWRRWCDERGLMLIEDGAQAWLSAGPSSPVGGQADIAIFCLYKAVGVPDGGAVLCRVPLPAATATRRLGLRRVAHRHVDWLAQRWTIAGRRRAAHLHAHAVEERPDTHFSLLHTDEPALAATQALISRAARPDAPAHRRANFAQLERRLGDLRSRAFPALHPNASPLAFPIDVDRKETVVARLAEDGVIDGKMWCVPHPALDVSAHPGAALLRRRLVGLPVHQELRPRDIDRIATAARRAAGG